MLKEGIIEDEIQFDDELDGTQDEIDFEETRRIVTDKTDPEIDSLYKKFKKGSLDVHPSFQRQFVWDKTKASRLIESAILRIPIPVVYLAEENSGKEIVIDGQQRLTSFFSFIDGKWPDDNTDFELTKLNVCKELIGKKFKDLDSSLQDSITSCPIRTITLRFEIFERLNTGSVSLNDQELRNCIYRGKFNDLLFTLSEDKDFRYLMNINKPDKRMKDVELILRFCAFYLNTYLKYKSPMRKFLNETMEEYKDISDLKKKEVEEAFKNSLMIIRSLLDKNAFKRFYRGKNISSDGFWEANKINHSLFDILMSSFASTDKNIVYKNLDSIREGFINLMTIDDDFIESIEKSTSGVNAVTIRFDKWRLLLQNIIGIGKKEERCFSSQLKKELFDIDPTCKICGNKINNIDDAAVDHIKQYWTGGETIPENARLTHRFCNWARSRKD